MTMNPFEQNEHLLHFLTSQVEREVIDYIRQEIRTRPHRTASQPKMNCLPSSNRRMNR